MDHRPSGMSPVPAAPGPAQRHDTPAPEPAQPPPLPPPDAPPASSSTSAPPPDAAHPGHDIPNVLPPSQVPECIGMSAARIAKLQQEAYSVRHQMLHLPKNPFCITCRQCLAQRRQARRGPGGLSREGLTYFGECFTLDHFVTRGDLNMGCEGKRAAVIIPDRWSDFTLAIPVPSKPSERAYEALC